MFCLSFSWVAAAAGAGMWKRRAVDSPMVWRNSRRSLAVVRVGDVLKGFVHADVVVRTVRARMAARRIGIAVMVAVWFWCLVGWGMGVGCVWVHTRDTTSYSLTANPCWRT